MIRIGPAGVPLSTPQPRSTIEGVRMCKKLGLPAMEVEFVQGVKMKDDLAATVGRESINTTVSLSVHAPYFINLCTEDEAKLEKSKMHILKSASAAHLMHASPVVFHPGFYQGREKRVCQKRAIDALEDILQRMERQGIDDVVLGPELTGKKSAYGDLDEIIELSRHFGTEKCMPVIDFGHYHARIERIVDSAGYLKILDKAEKSLGQRYVEEFHCHYSEISFSDAGELKHLPIGSGGPKHKPLLEVLEECGYDGTLICESPKLEEDALIIKKDYEKIAKNKTLAV